MFSLSKMFEKNKNDCIEWPYGDEHGYGTLYVKGIKWRAHRLVMFLLFPEEFKKHPNVNHKCDNKRCINPHHLYCGSQADNMRDLNFKDVPIALRLEHLEKTLEQERKRQLKPLGGIKNWRALNIVKRAS